MEARRPWYEAVATTRISTDARSADSVADDIVAWLSGVPA